MEMLISGIEILGWLALIVGGAVFLFKAVLTLALILMRGGLETIPPAIVAALIVAVAWAIFWTWMSPFSFSVAAQ